MKESTKTNTRVDILRLVPFCFIYIFSSIAEPVGKTQAYPDVAIAYVQY